MPHDDYYLFRACPDGEGTWTYSNSAAAAMRRKGSFTPEQVSWYVDKLRACDLAPVILVDVGGRMTEENRRIMSQCDRAVILSCDPEETDKWRSFCKDCGLSILAEIGSDYGAAQDGRPRTWEEERNGSGGAGKTRPEAMTPNDRKHQRRTKRKEKSDN